MSIENICLNCGAEKSPGYEYACVSCGSKFEDQEMQYKTEQEKRNRIRELKKLQKIERVKYFRIKEREREEYLKSEEIFKYCPSCGDLVRNKFKTCPKCGHEFTNDN